ncbi:sugar phosphate isomerase/epimerase family protein [Citricoccus sp. NR2]|uniref:sugar phosphate isomerase/epimerase family protein n=1 Tax=Citricoccus sp. NR2 TaxID=3004095 RepID=UPI0022DDFBE3|nr:sugar phosphate isomerase/epimerase family protein [Citricoccus sp. NR2]WBL20467.1 sugar phosphate isomerase/epimerase [Citricoccus sp. NR2]
MPEPRGADLSGAERTPIRPIPVTLSSSSVFTLHPQHVFAMAQDLGYDGIEMMVTQSAWSQDPVRLDQLSEQHEMPIHSIHAPTLLFTQQVWGSAWNKIARSADMARELGAELVVVHPPFRWQGNYARDFAEGIRDIMEATGIMITVENMYPWKVRGREAKMYLPHHDPVPLDYDFVTWDFSHAASAEADSLAAFRLLGERLRHVHLTDGTNTGKDDHLLPGHGAQPVAECLQFLGASGFTGSVCVEVSTRNAKYAGQREEMLAESLNFARRHLALGQRQARQQHQNQTPRETQEHP